MPSEHKHKASHKKPVTTKKKVVKRVARRRLAVTKRALPRYTLNPNYEFYDELRSLILKSSPAEMDSMIKRITNLGRVKLAIISGIFLNQDAGGAVADLFVVGDDINKDRLRTFLKALEAEVGKEIRFSLMEKEEFEYRFGMFDRFVRVLLEGPHEKIINKLGI
ncbi:MAG: hypothetical protein UW46_C0008G0009 [Candidatus Yanofskybacteria bacterium GW2011_GWF1_44_227]|uniref:Transcriptional regulator n=1 Tax=Candidatus Yanofskybacteria bacterium GW2011_GWE2_40_11 TaxID=1619033 RepID=A0A0G0TQY3_9BACT|nr:MAG: hypothetical protein UT69_C0003G0028 [Candidatus Yanofskybacteria bacterium GW2011_GWE1_40_10]KKR40247.1 MAG: hypothetical protein UT75_C0009G0020 [Candidatus Yanofskybacteria bacterium GW2011_GWE2_40_11]KKT15333.1 MAG: hypothetical protein UV97_C0009G0009 [Candidatus Yanofskybacteria bacterium GW2011_GWF2_43_596]KKT52977.1 MAG: hypothetical protein UW46_C0008G0009 [Candidatus Yanofskybacteria bacterium GW2011_GWF1_44_227]OGN36130.1 MAG: hypothetical protein A2241_00050 [Candidatus Yano